ncbi:MAG: hypothetical protein ACK4Z5_10520 [Brevundimonas sp.]
MVRVVGPVQWIVYPLLIALAATVVLATPIELFGLSLPEPVLLMPLAFAWPLIRPSVVAPAALLGGALFLDLFWGAPVGLWPLCLLAVYGAVLVSRNLLAGQETRALFIWYTVATLAAFLLAYLIVTLRVGNPPSVLALIMQIAPTLLAFPAADWLVQRFDDTDVRFR